MSIDWVEIESRLRQMEAVEEYDLFAIGYVIPQVVLAEQTYDGSITATDWLRQYIVTSIAEDNINDQDAQLIQQVLNAAIQ